MQGGVLLLPHNAFVLIQKRIPPPAPKKSRNSSKKNNAKPAAPEIDIDEGDDLMDAQDYPGSRKFRLAFDAKMFYGIKSELYVS
uniref:Uncharacterized protein n=1 Tax=Panagrolaimus davidi TaxID=227884 RepID=A0A914RD59_9BILA